MNVVGTVIGIEVAVPVPIIWVVPSEFTQYPVVVPPKLERLRESCAPACETKGPALEILALSGKVPVKGIVNTNGVPSANVPTMIRNTPIGLGLPEGAAGDFPPEKLKNRLLLYGSVTPPLG